jgi:CheY-like chemotaxis protein
MNRIVLVEDERIVAMVLKHELTTLGYNVVAIASNAADAVAAVAKHEPDVVLMDVMIEGDLDGIEAARQISMNSQVPIFYLTGEAETSTRDRAMHSSNILGYLIKPVNPYQLADILEQHRVERVQS